MATSSILENVKLTGLQEIEEFVNVLEISEKDPEFDYSSPQYEFVTDKDEIMQIMRKRYLKHER